MVQNKFSENFENSENWFYLYIMKLEEAKLQFIQNWGALGTQWGINRTMAQIHALLLVSTEPLSADDIMNELKVSRGNTNMNVRELIDWGIVEKILKPGERKEFFSAEKDIWKVAMRIIKERKRREVEPIINALGQLKEVEGNKSDKEVKAFADMMGDIHKFANQASKAVDGMVKMDEHWFTGTLLKIFK
ncbi:MAG: hypothetical protein K0Q79_2975 [Flavipsychrobacter sp.]|jgi:DNA-binding transcriptional regulator GbsR (MarR family)|nr:hypothetical protein [Flavipsychrobacter sp.]